MSFELLRSHYGHDPAGGLQGISEEVAFCVLCLSMTPLQSPDPARASSIYGRRYRRISLAEGSR